MHVFIRLPEYWTPQQAEVIHDFIDQLYDAIWNQYGEDLCEYWQRPESNRDLFEEEEAAS